MLTAVASGSVVATAVGSGEAVGVAEGSIVRVGFGPVGSGSVGTHAVKRRADAL